MLLLFYVVLVLTVLYRANIRRTSRAVRFSALFLVAFVALHSWYVPLGFAVATLVLVVTSRRRDKQIWASMQAAEERKRLELLQRVTQLRRTVYSVHVEVKGSLFLVKAFVIGDVFEQEPYYATVPYSRAFWAKSELSFVEFPKAIFGTDSKPVLCQPAVFHSPVNVHRMLEHRPPNPFKASDDLFTAADKLLAEMENWRLTAPS